MTGLYFRFIKLALTALFVAFPTMALAAAGQPTPGGFGFQESVTPIMDSIRTFHDGLLMWIISGITLLVLLLMVIVVVRFNKRTNPTPAKFTHNTLVEMVWTIVPILLLILIAVPSFGVLADQETIPDGQRKYLGANIFSWGEVEVPAPELTIKATGVQWNWEYEYTDDEVGFSAFMLSDDERNANKPNQPRLLAVDYELVVPVDTTVRVLVTGNDVIHAFAVPAFGIKIDAVPGRLNETWFNARKTGIYYGQCSELCGKDHSFMPIAVRVVSKDDYAKWMTAFKDGDIDAANLTLAAVN